MPVRANISAPHISGSFCCLTMRDLKREFLGLCTWLKSILSFDDNRPTNETGAAMVTGCPRRQDGEGRASGDWQRAPQARGGKGRPTATLLSPPAPFHSLSHSLGSIASHQPALIACQDPLSSPACFSSLHSFAHLSTPPPSLVLSVLPLRPYLDSPPYSPMYTSRGLVRIAPPSQGSRALLSAWSPPLACASCDAEFSCHARAALTTRRCTSPSPSAFGVRGTTLSPLGTFRFRPSGTSPSQAVYLPLRSISSSPSPLRSTGLPRMLASGRPSPLLASLSLARSLASTPPTPSGPTSGEAAASASTKPATSTVVSKDVSKPEKSLWDKVKHEAKHYWHGTKLLGQEVKISSKLQWKVLNGGTLTRREQRQVCPFLTFHPRST